MNEPNQQQPPQHETGLNMDGLVLMGMPGCGGCLQSAQWLEDQGITFRKYDVTTSQRIIAWVTQATGQRTVPQFFLNGHHVQGGFPQVQQLALQGQLQTPRVTQL